ncbi:Kinase, NEK [Giardia muris]|uniref:non-specific serine/threonine protein kinase n=1 Tax=Giardia muris TaxID=5742 RepID=A0A4Z1SSI3_GIAMU|nr:Kinase, NEK [Giardia muris]|eukprot:TNJ28902.1 Kinase, NEK [Giardia muris]
MTSVPGLFAGREHVSLQPEVAKVSDLYVFRQRLAVGRASTVHLCLDLTTGKQVAIRAVDASARDFSEEGLLRCVQTLSQARCPYVIRYDRILTGPTRKVYYLVSSLYKGTLEQFLSTSDRTNPALQARLHRWATQIIRGLAFLQEKIWWVNTGQVGGWNPILTSADILISGDRCVISPSLSQYSGVTVTIAHAILRRDLHYTAPENIDPDWRRTLTSSEYRASLTKEASSWSLGCLLHEMLVGKVPYTKAMLLGHRLSPPNPKFLFENPDQEMISLMRSLLSLDPKERRGLLDFTNNSTAHLEGTMPTQLLHQLDIAHLKHLLSEQRDELLKASQKIARLERELLEVREEDSMKTVELYRDARDRLEEDIFPHLQDELARLRDENRDLKRKLQETQIPTTETPLTDLPLSQLLIAEKVCMKKLHALRHRIKFLKAKEGAEKKHGRDCR